VRALVCANAISLGDIYCESSNVYLVYIGHGTFCIDKMQHIIEVSLNIHGRVIAQHFSVTIGAMLDLEYS
jgi:hypothetical protein